MMKTVKVELHCHSIYSKDSLLPVEQLILAARAAGIDKLAITDHNSILGALKAKEIDPQRIIIGEEILTSSGELLAYFLTEEVPPFLSPEETIKRLRDQGAIISAAHPYERRRHGWDERELIEIAPKIDAIEVFNARCMLSSHNRLAKQFALDNHMLQTVGSDAHTAREVGRATLQMPPFDNAEDFKSALQMATAQTKLSSPFIHMTSFYAKQWKKFRNIR